MIAPKFEAKNEPRPFIPLLVGQGKLARHLSYYLSHQSISFKHWPNARNLNDPSLSFLLSEVNAVWILVADRAIAEVSAKLRELAPKLPLIHSSAATSLANSLKDTFTLHPLQTFGPELYSASTYEQIPFMMIREECESMPTLKESIQKSFPNGSFEIPNSKRALYHAYCVMTANFPQLLWAAVEKDTQGLVPTPHQTFAPILKQTAENFLHFGAGAVTGPLVRGDRVTLELHETALKNSDLLPLYQQFVEVFSKKTFSTKPVETKELS